MKQTLTHPVVVGGGPVGLVLALSLQQSGVPVTVLEAQPPGAIYGDGRALALSSGTRQVLEQLGVWNALESKVTAIDTIHVSQQKGFGRALLKAGEHQLPALGYVVSYGALMQALDARIAESSSGLEIQYQVPVQNLHMDANAAEITFQTAGATDTQSTDVIATPLAIIADGGRSLESIPGLVRETKHYGHDALVGLVQTELPHRNIAYERFTPFGPMALLPNGEHFSLVWTGEQTYIDQIAALDDAAFLQALHQAFGDRVGKFLHIGKRGRFPLKLSKLEQTFPAHCVVIGNAAQTMHPVAGQGFNVGIRDAMALARNITASSAAEWGTVHRLAEYHQSRARDTGRGLIFTDFLVNVFSNDLIGVGLLRGAGLGALSMLPFARRLLVNKMSYGS
ncbi:MULTISPECIES: FAD-dependent monooxygenase [unclassified Methylophilus]|uniref:FAD-dependent monooxygenase n=1 Tax=unclassified Methylophilus TaxID=2630143 RepID=UPI0006F6B237|nr:MULTISPECIES: FAD-dependent monooxygenase [unclassified Methylophilus]KQT41679.1 2-octaprenyl-6-methoxyphenyl hydroxylase [Methylophilus sp. Leaf416]KQT55846.1 2-octaprenyl-6-methoxyphenyl hydroxylase [Methylophilus sp. Leaf459]